MGEWDIEHKRRQDAAFEAAKAQQRHLVEQLELRARAAEAEAKLRAIEAKNAAHKEAPRPKGWKRELAKEGVKAKFSNGQALNMARTSEIIRQVQAWLVENYPEKAGQISDDVIRTAAGRK